MLEAKWRQKEVYPKKILHKGYKARCTCRLATRTKSKSVAMVQTELIYFKGENVFPLAKHAQTKVYT